MFFCLPINIYYINEQNKKKIDKKTKFILNFKLEGCIKKVKKILNLVKKLINIKYQVQKITISLIKT